MDAEGNDSRSAVNEAFKDMKLRPELLEGIYNYGYKSPSEVQHKAILALQEGRNVLVEQSDPVNKSATICLATLQLLDFKDKKNQYQALLLIPDQLRAIKIGEDMCHLGRELGVKVHVVGHSDGSPDGADVLVGLDDLVTRLFCESSVDHIKIIVLDDKDDMDLEEVDPIFAKLKGEYRIAVFTKKDMQQLRGEVGEQFSKKLKIFDRIEGAVQAPELTLDGITHHLIVSAYGASTKLDELKILYHNKLKDTVSVVFVNSHDEIDDLVSVMKGLSIGSQFKVLKSSLETNQHGRDNISLELSCPCPGSGCMLVTAEEWAYGIDFQKVQFVVNYELDISVNNYLRRVGGFQFRGVVAVNFVEYFHVDMLFEIHKRYRVVFKICSFYSDTGFSAPENSKELVARDIKQCLLTIESNKTPDLAPNSKWLKRYPDINWLISREFGQSKTVSIALDIKHYFVDIGSDRGKSRAMFNLISIFEGKKSVVFVNTDAEFKSLSKRAEEKKENIKLKFFTALPDFLKCEDPCMLITTDKEATRCVCNYVPFVINFDLPSSPPDYDHRIAWCQQGGNVIHFYTQDDWLKVFYVHSKYGCTLTLGSKELIALMRN